MPESVPMSRGDKPSLSPAFSDVVQQRAERQQVRSRNAGSQRRRIDDGLDDVTVDGPFMGDVAGREVANRVPFGQQPAPQTIVVKSFDGVHRRGTRQEHNQ
jgi:hypothetical protein